MVIGSLRVSQLQCFLGLLLAMTICSIFLLMTVPTTLPIRTSYLTNYAVKSSSIPFNSSDAKSKIHLVTEPRLKTQTVKDKIILTSKAPVHFGVKDEIKGRSQVHVFKAVHSNVSKSHLRGVIIGHPVAKSRTIYSRLPAKWPEPIEWPKPWIRQQEPGYANQTNASVPTLESKAIVCDMNNLTTMLQPTLPPHFEIRRFLHLPIRYHSLLEEPLPYPSCGVSGLLSPWKLNDQENNTDGAQNKWMLFMIKSAPDNGENRKYVRDSWGAPENFKTHKIFLLFVVGKTNNESLNENMKKENELHGDLLQCDFIDVYRALPIKVLSTFRWILERDLKVDFYSLTDDDCLVNLPNLATFFDKEVTTDKDYHKKVYCGFRFSKDAKPLRHVGGKWSVTSAQYAGILYPTFCHGGLWILSKPLMHGLYCAAEITDVGDFFLEDVLITGILREKLNLRDTNIKRMLGNRVTIDNKLVYHSGGRKDSTKQFWREWSYWKKRWQTIKTMKSTV